MREVLAYILPWGSIGLILLLLYREGRRPPRREPLILCLKGAAADTLEGTVRLCLWQAAWRGWSPQIKLVDCGAPPPIRHIACCLTRAYPTAVEYHRPDPAEKLDVTRLDFLR